MSWVARAPEEAKPALRHLLYHSTVASMHLVGVWRVRGLAGTHCAWIHMDFGSGRVCSNPGERRRKVGARAASDGPWRACTLWIAPAVSPHSLPPASIPAASTAASGAASGAASTAGRRDGFVVDNDDSSLTRSNSYMLDLFEKAGVQVRVCVFRWGDVLPSFPGRKHLRSQAQRGPTIPMRPRAWKPPEGKGQC